MNFSLVFENSGDSIPFETISNETADVLQYYVEHLNQQQVNCFRSDAGTHIKNHIDRLDLTIKACNKFVFELLDGYIDTYDQEGYLDQRNLNKLHADWVRSQNLPYNIQQKRQKYQSEQAERIHDMFPDDIPEPLVNNVITKLGHRYIYDDINFAVHNLEDLFSELRFSVGKWIEIPNPFAKTILSNHVSNFRLTFNHLGRSLFDKFNNFDHDLEFDDENTFNELLGFAEIKLTPPQTVELSPEYVNWCIQKGKPPSGAYLNIGNIPDLGKNTTHYRKIVFRNTLQNNSFSIELHKGT